MTRLTDAEVADKPQRTRNPRACGYCWDAHQKLPHRWCPDGIDCGGNPLYLEARSR